MMANIFDLLILLSLVIGTGTLFLLMTMHQEQLNMRQEEVSKNNMEWV